MDGGGRLAGSLSDAAPPPAGTAAVDSRFRDAVARRRARAAIARALGAGPRCVARYARWLDRDRAIALPRCRAMPGSSPPSLIIAASAGYGAVRGGHVGEIVDDFKDVRDMAANAAGFNIASVALTGQKHLSREEILATAGVTGRASLLFFDVADARARLLTNPWIAEATVQKLLPDRLVITDHRTRSPLRCGRRTAGSA